MIKWLKEKSKKYKWLIWVILLAYSIKGIIMLFVGWKLFEWLGF